MALLFGIIGLVIISITIWIRKETKQNILFILGGLAMLYYSIAIKNTIFSILQVVFIASALIELIKIKNNNK